MRIKPAKSRSLWIRKGAWDDNISFSVDGVKIPRLVDQPVQSLWRLYTAELSESTWQPLSLPSPQMVWFQNQSKPPAREIQGLVPVNSATPTTQAYSMSSLDARWHWLRVGTDGVTTRCCTNWLNSKSHTDWRQMRLATSQDSGGSSSSSKGEKVRAAAQDIIPLLENVTWKLTSTGSWNSHTRSH